MKTFASRLKFTIGTKLIGLIAVLLVSSVASLVWLSTRMFIEDNTALIQTMTADTARGLAGQMREVFENLTDKMRILGAGMLQEYRTPDGRMRVINQAFNKDKDLLAIYVLTQPTQGTTISKTQAISPELANLNDRTGARTLALILHDASLSLNDVFEGSPKVSTLKLADGSGGLIVALPFIQLGSHFTHILVSVIRQSRLAPIFNDSSLMIPSFVDNTGRLLAHPDAARVRAGETIAHLDIFKSMAEGKQSNGQKRYYDPDLRGQMLGAYAVIGFAGLGVIVQIPEAKAFEAAKRVRYRSILVAMMVLCLSFLLGYFYSGTITWPIKQLVIAAKKISSGDFKIALLSKGEDELSHLSRAFNEMAKGLEERDRVKETFHKFHNKEIAEKLLSGAVKLGGEKKDAIVFFSDIRGFTAFSEALQPEEVVEMLNEYMTCMVAIIRAYGGIVDKYIGDAIMAVWGVPIGKEDDVRRAVRACLEMRTQLSLLNERRLSRKQPALKIGMGLNLGPVIAGNIGSDEKMEYTVIGDTVNLASRIESMTKEYGTDLLISEGVRVQVRDHFIFESCEAVRVKGKSEPIQIFKVAGYIENGITTRVETPYSSYAAEKSDKVVHDKAA